MASYRQVRGRQLNSKQRALLRLALSFFTWRTLVHESRLKQVAAIEAMFQVVVASRISKHSHAVP